MLCAVGTMIMHSVHRNKLAHNVKRVILGFWCFFCFPPPPPPQKNLSKQFIQAFTLLVFIFLARGFFSCYLLT